MSRAKAINLWGEYVSLAGVIVLSATLGYVIGRIAAAQFVLATVPPLKLVPDLRPLVPVVQIDGLRDGRVHGRTSSGVRLFIGGELALPDGSGAFAVAAGPLLTNEITVNVPPGMKFVASKNGSKYYPVDSAGGERIVPANRIYFATVGDAEALGYTP